MHLVDSTLFYSAESGGVLTYLRAKSHWLAKRHRVRHTIVAPSHNRLQDPSMTLVPSVPVPFLPPYRMPLSIAQATAALRKLEPDLIEIGDPYHFAWAGLRIKRENGIPLVGFCHTDLPCVVTQRFGVQAGRLAQAYLRRLYADFDLVLAPSRVTAERLRGFGIEQVRHQPLGVDTTLFSPQLRDPDFRARLGLSPSTRLLVYAGRLTRKKKLLLLIEAVRQLGQPYHLLLIGSGEELPSCANVSNFGYRCDPVELAQLLASCDFLVHPGDQETFGLVVLEAMACGVPVLGTASGGVPNWLMTIPVCWCSPIASMH